MLTLNTNNYQLSKSLSWEGIGVHTGVSSRVTINPNSEKGIVWRRVDVAPELPIPAKVRSIVGSNRSTDIGKGDIVIKTIEHLMSALYGAGIHDAEILVDGPEVPIMDGSSAVFYQDLIANREIAGTEQRKWNIDRVIHFEDKESGAAYTLIPSDQLEIEVYLDYDLPAGPKLYTSYKGDQDFDHVAEARTFVMSSELQSLRENNLINGGNVENGIVIADHSDASNQLRQVLDELKYTDVDQAIADFEAGPQLRGSDELARHKMLDLIGDLALLDLPICAKIIARKPGHRGNAALLKHLRPLVQKEIKVSGIVRYDPNQPALYDINEVLAMLPHRYPFALVDKVIETSKDHVVGVKNITYNEALFQGHFPGNPIFPGVLQLEAMAQTGGILVLSQVENPTDWDTYFLKIDNVKFKRKVVPGDTLIIRMVLASPIRRGIVHMLGTVFVGNKVVSEGELTAQIIDRTKQ